MSQVISQMRSALVSNGMVGNPSQSSQNKLGQSVDQIALTLIDVCCRIPLQCDNRRVYMKHDRLARILILAARMDKDNEAAKRMMNWKGNAGKSAGNFVEVAMEVRDLTSNQF